MVNERKLYGYSWKLKFSTPWNTVQDIFFRIFFHSHRDSIELNAMMLMMMKEYICLISEKYHVTYLVQFSRYKIFNDTVISQIFSTVLCRASIVSWIAACDSVTLLLLLKALLLYDCIGLCRFVDANVRCCICDAPPSMAKNINEPVQRTKYN